MKVPFLCLLFLCSGVAATATAQSLSPASPSDAPDVTVLKYSWAKERIGWERDPFSGTTESYGDMRRRVSDDRRQRQAQAAGNIGEANRVEREARAEQVIKARPPAPPRYAFIYKVSVKNAGEKAIKEIDWDYVFFDAATHEELGRHEFTSTEKIGPGKSKEITVFISVPPVKRISVHALDKKERDGLDEQIVLMRVLYADGTVWQRP